MAWGNLYERQEMVKFLLDMGVSEKIIRKTCPAEYGCSYAAINADIHSMRGIYYWGVTRKMKAFIQARDGSICQYCGIDDPEVSVIEHVIPWASGGHHKPYNLVFACHLCNTRKRRSVWIPANLDSITKDHPEWREKVILMAKNN